MPQITFNCDEETLNILEGLRGAMPLEEMMNFACAFGADQIQISALQDGSRKREDLLSQRLTMCFRKQHDLFNMPDPKPSRSLKAVD